MASSNGFFSQRNAHRNANAGTTLKRRIDNRGYNGGIGDFQEERNRYAPPQKRFRPQTHTQSQPQTQFLRSGKIPVYHNNNMSRVSQSYNYGDELITSNPSFALHNNDSSSSLPIPPNINYQNPFVYGNPNPQIVPFPLPYRNHDVSFDSLPEWVPNVSISRTLNPNFVSNTNPLPMVSVVSQSMPQSIVVSKDLSDLLNVLNNEKEKLTSEASEKNELPYGLSFDDPMSLKVRHESVIKSLYSDMPRQCSSCGVRFKCQEEHSKHMDWHVRKNRMAKTTTRLGQKPQQSRDWFASLSLWFSGGTVEAAKAAFGGDIETQKKKEEKEQQQHVVPADEDQKNCALCEEPFEDFFSHEDDDWMYKDAAYLTKNGPIVHVKCMPEPRPVKESRELPKVMSATVPLVAKAIVC